MEWCLRGGIYCFGRPVSLSFRLYLRRRVRAASSTDCRGETE
eukprot:COSAG02_NODE_9882_length_2084_cov_1.751134_4_plen_41_part_01